MKLMRRPYAYYEHQKINNLRELLNLGMKNRQNDVAFSFCEKDVLVKKTFADVYNDVINLSNYFNHNYHSKHIALIGQNSYNWIVTFWAIILSGNICVVIDKDIDKNDFTKLLKKSDTKIIYYSNYYCSFVKEMHYKTYTIDDINGYITQGSQRENKHIIDDNKPAAIFFTSGTTGPNKAVVLSQKNMASNIYGASSLFKPNGKVISFLPYHHAFGLITAVLKAFFYGEEVYINTSLKYIMDDFKKIKPDTIFVVPLFVESFYKQIWQTARKKGKTKKLKRAIMISNNLLRMGIDMRSKFFKDIQEEFGGNLKYVICGGAYLDKRYVKWFRSIGIEILNGYGITECGPVVSVNRNKYYKDGSVGVPCRDEEVVCINGEICVKGPNIMLGYYKDKKATAQVLVDGYFHTGDLGYIDKEGFVFITGRKKNIIILSNGENISPEAIEEELMQDKAVCEVVVYEKDNKLIAAIYPDEEYLGDEDYFEAMIYNYNKGKAKNHQIALVELRTEEFVKNSNKKIMRDRIEE